MSMERGKAGLGEESPGLFVWENGMGGNRGRVGSMLGVCGGKGARGGKSQNRNGGKGRGSGAGAGAGGEGRENRKKKKDPGRGSFQAGAEGFGGDALGGEHELVLGGDVLRVMFGVEVLGVEEDLEAGFV